MSKYHTLLGVFALLVLIGGGCANTAPESTDTTDETPVVTEETQSDTEATTVEVSDTGLTLMAETQENGDVLFTWDLIEDNIMEGITGFGLAHGTEENPEYPSQYWYTLGPDHIEKLWDRDVLWPTMPAGEQHFRVCLLVNNECEIYSNNVMVETK